MKDHVSVDTTARPADTLALNIEELHTSRCESMQKSKLNEIE